MLRLLIKFKTNNLIKIPIYNKAKINKIINYNNNSSNNKFINKNSLTNNNKDFKIINFFKVKTINKHFNNKIHFHK